MKYITPLEEFHPKLQSILKEFARKSHAVNLEVHSQSTLGRNLIEGKPDYKPEYKTAFFIDPRFPERTDRRERVGYVKFLPDAPIEVGSRLIKNDKYRRHSLEYNTKASKVESKIIKLMVEYIKPFSDNEMFNFNDLNTKQLVSAWRLEHNNEGSLIWTAYSDDLYTEIKHLRNLGVQFKTEKFARLAMNLELFEEHKARDTQPITVYRVFVEEGRVTVSEKVTDSHGDLSKLENGSIVSTTYNSLESLPEDILSGVSMLKILGGEPRTVLRGVGYRVSDNEFYLMKPLASNTNA
jgi:hypothetical protein